MDLHVGDIAPNFTLMITEERLIKLSDLQGKNVVLYFYPKDDTPGCTIEAKDFNSHKADFDKLDTVILGISKDDVSSHYKFKTKYSLRFDLASDSNAETATKYGVWVPKSMFGKKYMGIDRTTFLINKEGRISYIWSNVSVIGHANDVLSKIKEQQ
jgi:peroxiredoxin Q/BCP